MSAIAAPPTRSSAFRPPVVPPTRITYDGAPAPGEDSTQWLIREATRMLVMFRTRYVTDDIAISPLFWRMVLERWKQWLDKEFELVSLVEEVGDLPPPFLAAVLPPAPVHITNQDARRLSNLISDYQEALREVEGEIQRDIAAQFPLRNPSEE